MAWELGLGPVYYLAAGVFQLGLAALVLSTDRRDPLRIGFATLLGLAALQTFAILSRTVGWYAFEGPTIGLLDNGILYTIVFLATQFPTALGGEEHRDTAFKAWLAVLAVTMGLYGISWFLSPELYDQGRNFVHATPFALGTGALAVHLVPRWLELEPGPLKTQTLYAGAGLAMSGAWLAGTRLDNFLEPGQLAVDVFIKYNHATNVVTIWFVGAILWRLGHAYLRDREGATLAFTALVATGLLLGLRENFVSTDAVSEIAAQVGRPILLALAMLRFDLFRIPTSVRRSALPAIAGLFVAVLFLGLTALFSPEGLDAQQLSPAAAVGAMALITVVGVGAREWLRETLVRPIDREGTTEDRIDRYRLALERARAEGGQEDLAAVRERLGITDQEHAVLEHLLREHLVLPSSAVRGAQAGDVIGERYEVQEELGRGGHGRAVRAWDRDQERSVVLKEVLHPWEEGADERRARLEREVEVSETVQAAGLAPVYDLVQHGPRTYLVRAYVPGETLDEHLRRQGPMTPERAAATIVAIARAVDRLHAHGLLHLDLKPGNVVLTDEGEPVIIDHGTVQTVSDEQGATQTATLSDTSGAVGTLAWMAPEQVLQEPVDERTDIFALGALLYHLATGETHIPVEDRPRYEIEDALVRGGPPEEIGPELGPAIRAALTRDREARPASVAAFLEHLDGDPVGETSRPEDQPAQADAEHVPR